MSKRTIFILYNLTLMSSQATQTFSFFFSSSQNPYQNTLSHLLHDHPNKRGFTAFSRKSLFFIVFCFSSLILDQFTCSVFFRHFYVLKTPVWEFLKSRALRFPSLSDQFTCKLFLFYHVQQFSPPFLCLFK